MRERPSLHLKGRPSRASFVLCPLHSALYWSIRSARRPARRSASHRVPPPVRRRQLYLPAAISALKSN